MLDSTSVKAHQHNAGARKKGECEAIGRSAGGLTIKIHATVSRYWQQNGTVVKNKFSIRC